MENQNARADTETFTNCIYQKRLIIQPMVNKYFHLGVTVELPVGIRATVTISLVQNYGLRMKEGKDNKKFHQMIHFHIVNQS